MAERRQHADRAADHDEERDLEDRQPDEDQKAAKDPRRTPPFRGRSDGLRAPEPLHR